MTQPMTDDSLATILLTTGLAVPRSGELEQLKSSEWAMLVRALVAVDATPRRVLGRSSSELQADLGLPQPLAERVVSLLDRAGMAAIELQRLADLGIWRLTKLDEDYPVRLKQRLPSHQSPSVLFGAGSRALFARGGVAIVGSRNADEASLSFAGQLGQRCAFAGLNAVSGAARGVDRMAMMAALEAGGTAIGVMADSLESMIRASDVRRYLLDDQLVLVTASLPTARFLAWKSMERNKYIYCLADFAVVVATDADKGGTWAGAKENLGNDWTPLFVRSEPGSPAGNRKLLSERAKDGRSPRPMTAVPDPHEFGDWLHSRASEPQGTLRLPWDVPAPNPVELPATAKVEEVASSYRVERDASGTSDSAGEIEVERVDFFEVCWPYLARILVEPTTEALILASCDGLDKAQLKKWLTQGIDSGRVVKQVRPVRYSLRHGDLNGTARSTESDGHVGAEMISHAGQLPVGPEQ